VYQCYSSCNFGYHYMICSIKTRKINSAKIKGCCWTLFWINSIHFTTIHSHLVLPVATFQEIYPQQFCTCTSQQELPDLAILKEEYKTWSSPLCNLLLLHLYPNTFLMTQFSKFLIIFYTYSKTLPPYKCFDNTEVLYTTNLKHMKLSTVNGTLSLKSMTNDNSKKRMCIYIWKLQVVCRKVKYLLAWNPLKWIHYHTMVNIIGWGMKII